MQLFSPNHPVGRALNFLVDAFCICVVWAVLSLPIVTMGATCSALCRVAINWVRLKDQCNVRFFLQAVKENFRKGTGLWLIMLPLLLLILTNGYLVWFSPVSMPGFAKWSFFVAGFLWLITAVHMFALQATFDNTVGRTLSNALRIALANLPTSLVMVLILGVAVALSLIFPPALFVLYPWAAFLNATFNWKILKQFAPKQESQDEDDWKVEV